MPDVLTYTPTPGYKAFRLMAVTVNAQFSRHFAVPEYEVGVLKAGWRGTDVSVTPTADITIVPDNPESVFRSLCAKYGEVSVTRFHPGPERLGEDMDRYAATTLEFIERCKAVADTETKKRIAAEREAVLLREAAAIRAKPPVDVPQPAQRKAQKD